MRVVVQKYGGTSVADAARIVHVAKCVAEQAASGHAMVVVVSAMHGTTNQLVDYARAVHLLHTPEARAEYDVITASGEQITAGMLALALQNMGIEARSWLGWQLPCRVDTHHGEARIRHVETQALHAFLSPGRVAVVAGFQGVTEQGRVATLGRGGSDITAVALAAALEAERCDIYTDVEGVYTADPRIVPRARKLLALTYEEMLEMASLGAKVLQTRSVALAMQYGVRIHVLSSFSDMPGTYICDEDEVRSQTMEERSITAVTHSQDDARITLLHMPELPTAISAVFKALADAQIHVDMIVHNIGAPHGCNLTFTISKQHVRTATTLLHGLNNDQIRYFETLQLDEHVAKISVVGLSMRSHTDIAHTLFHTLAERGIQLLVVSSSEIKISVLIPSEYTELAVRALHQAYGLNSTS